MNAKNKIKIATIVAIALVGMFAYKKWWENKEKNKTKNQPEPQDLEPKIDNCKKRWN